MLNWKRIILYFIAALVGLIILTAIFISPIAKYVIEKYSEPYTGRLINMDYLRINLFTGEVNVKGFRIYEKGRRGIFISVGEINSRVALLRMIYSNFLIKKLTIDRPVVRIAQKGNHFNYDDLVERFLQDDKPPVPGEQPTPYWVKQFAINDATLVYSNNKPAVSVSLIRTFANISDISWDNPTYHIALSSRLQTGGDAKVTLDFNSSSMNYFLEGDVQQFNINWMAINRFKIVLDN
jgi:hypothetical protein